MVTNYIKGASYKEIYDLHTDSESSSILTIHSPVSNYPRQMLGGFWKQYRRFKYRGARVTLRPASRLPADPAQLSYAAGEPEIDARDMLNPILTRGYCGESLGYFLNTFMVPGAQQLVHQAASGDSRVRYSGDGFIGSSVDKTSFIETPGAGDLRNAYLQQLYYQSLSDPGFKKIPMQRGYSRFFYPLIYELATTVQRLAKPVQQNFISKPADEAYTTGQTFQNRDVAERGYAADMRPDDSSTRDVEFGPPNKPGTTSDTQYYTRAVEEVAAPAQVYSSFQGTIASAVNGYYAMRTSEPILTSHKRRLGWLDTDTRVVNASEKTGDVVGTASSAYPNFLSPTTAASDLLDEARADQTCLPLLNMGLFVLPKAHKTEMYYRLEVQHVFDFKDYRPLCGLVSPFDESSIKGGVLEWADWDNTIGGITPGPSVTSTAKNFALVDVVDTSAASVSEN